MNISNNPKESNRIQQSPLQSHRGQKDLQDSQQILMKYYLIFDVTRLGCKLHLQENEHETDNKDKERLRWGLLELPAHPPIIISLVSPLLGDPALALQHVAVSLLNCSLGGHNHTEALLCVSVLL